MHDGNYVEPKVEKEPKKIWSHFTSFPNIFSLNKQKIEKHFFLLFFGCRLLVDVNSRIFRRSENCFYYQYWSDEIKNRNLISTSWAYNTFRNILYANWKIFIINGVRWWSYKHIKTKHEKYPTTEYYFKVMR